MSDGVEDIRTTLGNQTTLDLRDLVVGVSYAVSVTALVGDNAGDPVTVYIRPGEIRSTSPVLLTHSSDTHLSR